MTKQQRIGIDTGGTFTDVAVVGRGGLRIHKLPSTPADPSRAVLAGLEATREGERPVDLVHGTTVGLNAVLTGRVAKTAFVTNEGFVDLVEIGRQARSDIYDLAARKPTFPVPRRLRFGIDSRRDAAGRRLAKPTKARLRELAATLRKRGVESVAIGLLHSYAWPEDELEVRDALRDLGVPTTCSADLLPVSGEYERFATAAINAAIAPVMERYLARVEDGIDAGQLRLMRSSGGVMGSDEARRYPARAVFSGPAGGVAACADLARRIDEPRVATLDMGGTSTDVALVHAHDDAPAASGRIAGLPLAAPSLDVHTIGCGGGSIAYADVGGALRVGPQSAGAIPGPACYGQGEEPTVTDAHVALGHLGASTLLGGDFTIDPDRSVRVIEQLGKRLGLTPLACARGILEVAEIAMVRAVLVMTVERRIDPATLPLVAFGGAGGLHVAGLVRRLGMRFGIVPDHPGAFSAVGLALAGESREATRTILKPLDELSESQRARLVRDLAAEARSGLEQTRRPRARCHALVRFAGQGGGLWVDANGGLEPAFRRAHATMFGFEPDGRTIELVELRARASGTGVPMPRSEAPSAKGSKPRANTRRAPLGGAELAIYARSELQIGTRLRGPLLIEEHTSVTVVPSGFSVTTTAHGLELRNG